MIKNIPITEENIQLLPKASEYLRAREDVLFAYLFGGIAKNKLKPMSDIDIAIYLADNNNVSQKRMEILGDLTNILKTDEIDLVVLNDAPIPLSIRIIRDRKLLAENSPFERHKYESLTMRKAFDFEIKEKAILKGRYAIG